jgi:Protein of unknown function (DUF2628)
MGLTTAIVSLLILCGFFTVFVWLARTLHAYQPIKVGTVPAEFVEDDLRSRTTPGKLTWNWWAFFLGPVWFLAEGMWVHAIIMMILIGLSGGILLPFVMVYSGAKARETLADARLMRDTYY